MGRTTEIMRDSQGRIASLEKPSGATWTLSYQDGTDSISSITDPLGQTKSFEYDPRLNRSKVTDEMGHQTATQYDDLDLPSQVTQNYGYDSDGRIVSLEQVIGGITRTASFTYDLLGRRKTITYPAGFVVQYDYDADGQISAIKKDGSVTPTTRRAASRPARLPMEW